MADIPMDRSIGAGINLESGYARSAHACRWGVLTLYQPFPDWLGAWDTPWTCRHPAHRGPLETVDTCSTCPDWSPSSPRDSLSTRKP